MIILRTRNLRLFQLRFLVSESFISSSVSSFVAISLTMQSSFHVNITLDWHQAVSRGGNHSIQTLPLWCFYNVTRLNVEGVLMHLKIWTRRKIEEHIAKKGEVRKQVQAQIQCKVLESTFFCWHLKNRSYSWVCILHSVSWLLLVQVYSCWVWQGSHLLER